jgi:CheY-like chemotaxis protein
MQADPRLTTVPVIIFSNAPLTEVPPDSSLAQGTKRLLKSDCTFPKLLETIEDSLAKAPELVVVEANKKPSARPVAAKNGKAEIKAEIKNDRADIIPPPDFGRGIPKPLADFLAEAPTIMPKLRDHSMGYIKAPDSESGQTHLNGLLQRVSLLQTSATQAGCARVGMLMSAFDSLLSAIKEKPSSVTPSMLQTIAQTVDCLDGLLKAKDGYSAGPAIHARVLVVDDDAVCNQVNVTSLKRANFETKGVKDPAEALTLLETTAYDLVVLDVNMPGMTGFDVCEKLRRLPNNKKTPVIFVTAFSSFDNRKQSVLSGGNDFVSKPVSPVELALKVAINLIKARVPGSSGPQSAPPPAEINGSSHAPQPSAKTMNDQQSSTETPQPEPPSRLASLPESGTRNTRIAGSLSGTPPETKPNPTGQRNKNDSPGTDIHERLRQSTAALDHAKAGLEQESAERARIETQWREQLNAAKALVGQTETVLKEKEAQNAQLEKELAELRKAKDELQDQLATGQQAAAKAQQEVKELQERVSQGMKELERSKTAWEQQTAERTRVEAELREQLNKAKTATGAAEAVLKEKEARCGQLEKEVAGVQQAREELQNKFTAGQQAAEKLQHEIKELQAGLGQQTAEKMRLESEWREKLNAANATTVRVETTLKEKEAQNAQLEKELAGLRQSRDELQNKVAAEQQAVAKSRQETKELDERLRQHIAELERARAGLEQESAKRTRLESEYQNLVAAREALNQELSGLRESQAARDVEMRDKQKKLAEGLRENIQLLQSKLQEAEAMGGDAHRPNPDKSKAR